MEYLSSDKVLIVDLSTSEVTEDELDEDLVARYIGGAGITRHLYEEHADGDPIVLGTGLLTGTLYPASALGVLTVKSPRTGGLCHSPFTLATGIELKYAGFDYVVVKGASDKPVFLWIHDGVADINDASEVWGTDVWETTDAWRKALGDDLIQTLVIGPAGEAESDYAQVCLNYWASGDRFGAGKIFGSKKLKGIALRGMGLLEVADPEGFVDRCLEILQEIKNGAAAGKGGIGPILEAMGESGAEEWIAPLVHRHRACYNTPYPSNTFVYLDEDPNTLTEPEHPEPGFLITDPFGLLGFKKLGLDAPAACRLLRTCAKYGIDAAAVAELSAQAGLKDEASVEGSLASLSGEVTLPGKGIFSPCCPVQPLFADFGLSGAEDTEAWWERRQAVAYMFGIHPLFALMAPELKEADMLELTNLGTEMELSEETLDQAVAELCG